MRACEHPLLRRPSLWGGLLVLTLAGAAAPGARAGGDHEAPAAPAASSPLTMDQLRERLAEKLGAAKAPESRSPYVVRVENKDKGGAEAPPAKRAAKAPPARKEAAHEPAADAHGGHPPHWSYDGPAGPQGWARLAPEFAQCATGQRQSPIDIRDGIPVQLPPIAFDYRPTSFQVVDNGHTIQVNPAPGNSITVNGRRYELLQFHFHRPSEERVNGRAFDMVVHLVHKDAEGRLAVVAVLLERGSAHPQIQAVWNSLPLEKGDSLASPVSLDLAALLPQDGRYYTYMGSLTTPPCSEGVLWLVMKQPVTLSPEQIGIFARLYPMNARPVQATSGRLIKDGH